MTAFWKKLCRQGISQDRTLHCNQLLFIAALGGSFLGNDSRKGLF